MKDQKRLDEALKKLRDDGLLNPDDMKHASIEVRNTERKMKEKIEYQKKTKREINLKLYLNGLNII
jgi:hypothetical protein